MCGRFARASSVEYLISLIKGVLPDLILEDSLSAAPSYNIPPSASVLAVGRSRPELPHKMTLLKWGFVPGFAKDLAGARPINARTDTVREKPMFRNAFARRRCLILADGFYEWKRDKSKKQPYYFRLKNGKPMAFGGIYDVWKGGDEPLATCAMLTTDANDLMLRIHDRMPVIVPPEHYARWCDPRRDGDAAADLLAPLPAEEMQMHPVAPAMNNPRFDGAACIEPVPEPRDDAPAAKEQGDFFSPQNGDYGE